jgi:hypothetical protein
MKGGYKVPYNPVSALRKLETGINQDEAWKELWNELHHQGDVGEASYAAVPHLARIQKEKQSLNWNLYALASVIEMQRHAKKNPPLPDWLQADYASARQELTMLAIEDLKRANDPITVRALRACIAFGKGELTMGTMILEFGEDERIEILDQYWGGWSGCYE